MLAFMHFARPFESKLVHFEFFTDEIVFMCSCCLMAIFVKKRTPKTSSTVAFTIIGIYILGMAKNMIIVFYRNYKALKDKFKKKKEEKTETKEEGQEQTHSRQRTSRIERVLHFPMEERKRPRIP